MDYSEYLTVLNDPNPPYSPVPDMRQIEESLIALSRATTCIPSEVRLNPADVHKLQSSIPASESAFPPPVHALLGVAVIVDPDVPVGVPEWGECRHHREGQACRLRKEA